MKKLELFEEKIGVKFKTPALLAEALVHRSYLNEHKDTGLSHNERLEFLGDAVLELVITDHLFRKYPKENEGTLTAYRAALVNANTLGEIAAGLGVNDYLLLSKGESKDNGRARQVILANAIEAIIGAIYLDQGYDVAANFIGRYFFDQVAAIVTSERFRDAKSFFQEKSQEISGFTPAYRVLAEAGPDHDKTFTVGLYLGEEKVAEGTGHSKQEAEQAAAAAGLLAKNWPMNGK